MDKIMTGKREGSVMLSKGNKQINIALRQVSKLSLEMGTLLAWLKQKIWGQKQQRKKLKKKNMESQPLSIS